MMIRKADIQKHLKPGLAALAVFCVLVAALYMIWPGGKNSLPGKGTGAFVMAGGLEPGAEISYQLIAGNGKSLAGAVTADERGNASLPGFEIPAEKNAALIYRLSIQRQPGNQTLAPVDIALRLDGTRKKLSIEGSGFEEFSDVVVVRPDTHSAIKTDWAGLLHEMDALDLNVLDNPRGVRIAFQSFNMESDALSMHPSPYIQIQQLETQGEGGQYIDPNLNLWTPTGSPDLSTYDIAAVDATIPPMVNYFVTGMIMMAEQFSAGMMQQVQIIGSFLDAKLQMETQEKLRQLHAEANKDYHPSEGMCRIGSYIKSVAKSEEKAQQNKLALNRILSERHLASMNSMTTEGYDVDVRARLQQFKTTYCDVKDNNDGLGDMCDHDGNFSGGPSGAIDKARANIDIDFTRLVQNKLTLDVDFTNAAGPAAEADTEEDIIALARNLYWPRALIIADKEKILGNYHAYIEVRRLITAENIAMNSFVSLIGAKSKSPAGLGADSGWAYMKAMMREFGLADGDIHALLGNNPSYYAQMDVLTKKIYQHPNFFTNLYDKPANVDRIGASLRAIELMNERDRFEGSLRREMLISQLVEDALKKHQEDINVRLFSGMKTTQP